MDGTVRRHSPMEHCGWNCLRAVTNGGMWMELSEGNDHWSIVEGNV